MKEFYEMERKLRILAVSYLFPNKVYPNHGIFVLNRLKALNKYVDIKVINPVPWSPVHEFIDRYKDYRSIATFDKGFGLDVYHPRYFSIPRYLKGIEKYSYTRAVESVVNELMKEGRFDLVDMHWTFPDLPAGMRIANKYKIPSIVTLRGMEALHLNENTARSRLVSLGLRDVGRIIALSHELKEQGDILSGTPDKSTVITNGVDTEEFYYMPMDSCRKKLDIPEGEVFILSIGSIIKRKGFDILIKALNELRLKPDFKSLKLYIVGSEGAEGDYREDLSHLINKLGLADVVKFVGQVANADLRCWYNSCDVFCLASRGEGSPNVLSEALACGCLVVSSNAGSARDIIDLGKSSGICLDDNTAAAFSQAINDMYDRDVNRKEGAAAYQAFDWDWCARKVLSVYKQCVA